MERVMWPAIRSDAVVLPALALLTAAACIAGLELAARLVMPEQLAEPCQTSAGSFRAGCASEMKAAEGHWITVAYNACGSRSIHPCEALPTENRVVVVIGSSIGRGYAVKYQEMFAPRAEAMLAQACPTPVVFQNLSIRWPTEPKSAAWSNVAVAAREAAALHPKTIMMFVTHWDLSLYHEDSSAAPRSGWKATSVFRVLSFIARTVRQARESSRVVLAMRHFLNRRDQVFVDGFLMKGDETAYLRSAWSAAWNARIAMLTRFAEPVAAEARLAGAGFVVVYIPFEPDVLLAQHRAVEADTNPFALPDKLAAAASSHDWRFVDTLPTFALAEPQHPQFYRINTHPNAEGHAAIARAIGHALAGDATFCSRSP
jgi:hypothetical protein